MVFSLFNYVDQLINSIRPNKIIFIAVDGVALRAKMNNKEQEVLEQLRNQRA
jgi:5'-3' exonuclease